MTHLAGGSFFIPARSLLLPNRRIDTPIGSTRSFLQWRITTGPCCSRPTRLRRPGARGKRHARSSAFIAAMWGLLPSHVKRAPSTASCIWAAAMSWICRSRVVARLTPDPASESISRKPAICRHCLSATCLAIFPIGRATDSNFIGKPVETGRRAGTELPEGIRRFAPVN